ncbi:MAG: hypothetical protein Q8Q24_00190 [bacterium]|nr:hypothetical protein [bacterium]
MNKLEKQKLLLVLDKQTHYPAKKEDLIDLCAKMKVGETDKEWLARNLPAKTYKDIKEVDDAIVEYLCENLVEYFK